MVKGTQNHDAGPAHYVSAALHSLKKTTPMARWRFRDYGKGLSPADRDALWNAFVGADGITLPSGIRLTQAEFCSLRDRLSRMTRIRDRRTGPTDGQRRYAAMIMRNGWG